MLVDMHLHECTYSTDSFLHLEEIVSIARQKGLDAICITDHDSMGLRERAEAYSREIGYPIFVGVEFFSLWGDITAWGIDGIPDHRIDAQDFIDLVREKDGFGELLKTLDQLNDMDCGCRILYMDCDIRTLVRRYKESRRPHPLSAPGLTVEDAIRKEEQLLAPIRERADYIVNTSNLTLGMLQNRLFSIFVQDGRKRDLDITVMSFGYKHGLPMDADLVFDARFLPNPYYVEDLRPMCGLDRPVRDFVFSYQQTREFMEMLEHMIEFLLPLYIEEGKLGLTIAIGCTGGHHRSVAVAHALAEYIQNAGYPVTETHRDITR